ncbi:MAG TPA: cytochrome c oxidase subunit II [Bryobacteraceae bacterium]|nr:cytochrome c oxidase subunit II [Bryobacteraceae bacterium]
MEWLTRLMMPPAGSEYAKEIDFMYMGLFWLCGFLFLTIVIPAFYFIWRYRHRPGRVTPHVTHNTAVEIVWTIIPLLICVAIFFWGLKGWMEYAVAPGDAMEVQITAKKWLWQFEYPDGSRTINDLHVPVNKNVKFVMTSEDVIHDFFVPDMRVKHDIIPGRYTEVWFNPTALGKHVITCAEYCGKGHSDMHAVLTVENDADFAKFLETGGTEWEDYFNGKDPHKTPADWGRVQYETKGCNSCHTLDGTKSKGPSWKGIWGKMETLNNGQKVLVDEAYVRESMMNPSAKVVNGFEPIMPSFQGLLKENQIKGLIAFIQSLQ